MWLEYFLQANGCWEGWTSAAKAAFDGIGNVAALRASGQTKAATHKREVLLAEGSQGFVGGA
jgi:hypothetical protein